MNRIKSNMTNEYEYDYDCDDYSQEAEYFSDDATLHSYSSCDSWRTEHMCVIMAQPKAIRIVERDLDYIEKYLYTNHQLGKNINKTTKDAQRSKSNEEKMSHSAKIWDKMEKNIVDLSKVIDKEEVTKAEKSKKEEEEAAKELELQSRRLNDKRTNHKKHHHNNHHNNDHYNNNDNNNNNNNNRRSSLLLREDNKVVIDRKRLCKFGLKCSMKNSCDRTHSVDDWTPQLCKFAKGCRNLNRCKYIHSNESKKECLTRLVNIADTFYHRNRQIYIKNFNLPNKNE